MDIPAGFAVLCDTDEHKCAACLKPVCDKMYLNLCQHLLCGRCALEPDDCPLCLTPARVATGVRYKCTTCGVAIATRYDADAHRCRRPLGATEGETDQVRGVALRMGELGITTPPRHETPAAATPFVFTPPRDAKVGTPLGTQPHRFNWSTDIAVDRHPSEEGAGDAVEVATQPRRRSPISPVSGDTEPAAGGGGGNDSPFGAAFRALQFGASPQRAPQPAAAAVQSATPVRRHVDPVGPQTVVRRATPPPAAPTPAAVPSSISALVRSLQAQGWSNRDIAVNAGYQSANYDRDVDRMLGGTCQRQDERHRDLVAALWNKGGAVSSTFAPRQLFAQAPTAAVSSFTTTMASNYAKPKAASATPVDSLSSAVAALRSKGFSNKDIALQAGYSGWNNARDVERMASGQCTGHTERLGRLKQLLK